MFYASNKELVAQCFVANVVPSWESHFLNAGFRTDHLFPPSTCFFEHCRCSISDLDTKLTVFETVKVLDVQANAEQKSKTSNIRGGSGEGLKKKKEDCESNPLSCSGGSRTRTNVHRYQPLPITPRERLPTSYMLFNVFE